MQEFPWRMAPLGVGERLRSARQALGLSLEEIESVTRIRRTYLEALEQEAFDDLPGPTYGRGFLRVYAAFLGIPPQELLDQYPRSQAGPIPHRASPVEVRLTPATRLSPVRRLMIGVGVVLALGVLALGTVLYGQLRQFAETRPAVPQARLPQRAGSSHQAAPSGSPAARSPAPIGPGPQATPASPGVSPAKGAAGTSAPPGPSSASTAALPASKAVGPSAPGRPAPSGGPPPAGSPAPGSPAPPGAAAPGKPSVPPASQTPGATPSAGATPAGRPAAPLHVVVAASGYSWVRTVADGTTVYEGFLNAGDKQVWEAKRSLTVTVGNASAVDVSVNGRSLGRLGGPGQIYEHTFSAGAPTP